MSNQSRIVIAYPTFVILDGTYRIKRGPDEEVVSLNKGLMNGPYLRLRDGILREEGYYVDGMRNGPFVEYYQDGVTHRKDTPMNAGKIDGKVTTYSGTGDEGTYTNYRFEDAVSGTYINIYSAASSFHCPENEWLDPYVESGEDITVAFYINSQSSSGRWRGNIVYIYDDAQ